MTKSLNLIASIAIFGIGTLVFTSCEKEATKNDSVLQLKSLPSDDCDIKPDIPGLFNPGATRYCKAGLITHCDYTERGNCYKPVIIQPKSGLDEIVSGGPDAVAKFFSGDVWKKYWPTIDNETIEELVSGEYYFHKMYRSEDSYFYAASKSKVINSDIEYLIVLPVITSVE